MKYESLYTKILQWTNAVSRRERNKDSEKLLSQAKRRKSWVTRKVNHEPTRVLCVTISAHHNR